MQEIRNKTFGEERALYASRELRLYNCAFDGEEDGESALKESSDITAEDCFCNLRYPFWHDKRLALRRCTLTPACRAALWYSRDIVAENCKLHGIKALRECDGVRMLDCDIVSPEFGWSSRDVFARDCKAESEYFMFRAERLDFARVSLKGKYSFQYITDSVFESCDFNTKDAFWHARNVTVRNCRIKGEYFAWYSENLTLENCEISGTQPLCYCRGLRLIDCTMTDADLAFEKSDVTATVQSDVVSIKNPRSGEIRVPSVGEIIMDDPEAHGTVIAG